MGEGAVPGVGLSYLPLLKNTELQKTSESIPITPNRAEPVTTTGPIKSTAVDDQPCFLSAPAGPAPEALCLLLLLLLLLLLVVTLVTFSYSNT